MQQGNFTVKKTAMWNFAKKKNLLIVDDDEVMVLLLKKLFEKKYTVFTASDGVEAIRLLSQGLFPEVVITDILMANINGYEFIDHLRTSIVYKNVPIVVLSNLPIAELNSYKQNFRIMNKPFDPIQLRDVVDGLVVKNYDKSYMQ